MEEIGMHEAKTQLSELIDSALEGEEILITRRGKPVARLEPIKQGKVPFSELRGAWKDDPSFYMAEDFDEFDDELAEMFGMKD